MCFNMDSARFVQTLFDIFYSTILNQRVRPALTRAGSVAILRSRSQHRGREGVQRRSTDGKAVRCRRSMREQRLAVCSVLRLFATFFVLREIAFHVKIADDKFVQTSLCSISRRLLFEDKRRINFCWVIRCRVE